MVRSADKHTGDCWEPTPGHHDVYFVGIPKEACREREKGGENMGKPTARPHLPFGKRVFSG